MEISRNVEILLIMLMVLGVREVDGSSKICAKHTSATASLYNNRTRRCYYYYDSASVWVDAKDKCESENTNLLHLETPTEQNWLREALADVKVTSQPLWLGMTSSADWYWSWHYRKSDRPLKKKHWSPSVAGVHPASVWLLSDGAWQQTGSPSLSAEFVCEDPDPSEVTWPHHCFWNLPNTTVLYDAADMRCYYVEEMMSWNASRSACEMAGTNLIHLETADEQAWIFGELKARGLLCDLWLGLKKGSDRVWSWVRGLERTTMEPRVWSGYRSSGPTQARLTTAGYMVQTKETDQYLAVCEGDEFRSLLSKYLCMDHSDLAGTVFDPASLHCYYVKQFRGRMDEAFTFCFNKQFYILQLETEAEQNMLYNEVYPMILSFDLWVGAVYSENDWVWLRNNKTKITPGPGWPHLVVPSNYSSSDVINNAIVAAANETWYLDSLNSNHDIVCEEDLDLDYVTSYICQGFPEAFAVLSLDMRRCYFVFSESRDWQNATDVCKAEKDAYVLNLETPREQLWLESKLNDIGHLTTMWMGLHRTAFDQWSWLYPNYSEVTNDRRFVNYNNRGPEHACTATMGTWSQKKDTDWCGLICERPITPGMLLRSKQNREPHDTNTGNSSFSENAQTTPSSNMQSSPSPPKYTASATTTSEKARPDENTYNDNILPMTSSTVTATAYATTTADAKTSTSTTTTTNTPKSFLSCEDDGDGTSQQSITSDKFKREPYFASGFSFKVIENSRKLTCAKTCALLADCDLFVTSRGKTCNLITFSYVGDVIDCSQNDSCYWKECKLKDLERHVMIIPG